MPDLIIFLVGLFAFVPFLGGLALMLVMAARSSQQVENDQILLRFLYHAWIEIDSGVMALDRSAIKERE